MYGKSLLEEGAGGSLTCSRLGASKNENDGELCVTAGCQHDFQDPSVHPWGGLTTTRDGTLTVMDCYLYSESLKGLQNVFTNFKFVDYLFTCSFFLVCNIVTYCSSLLLESGL